MKIINQKSLIKNHESGFTLIELLAVIVVVVIVGGIVVGIIVSTLRGTTKTNNLSTIRENGNYAILQVSKTIRFARAFQGIGWEDFYLTSCTATESAEYKYLKIETSDGDNVVFSCTENPATIASNGASLINTDKIAVSTCYFTCRQDSIAQSPTIGINLILSEKVASNLSEHRNIVPFQTSVTILNPNR